MSLWYQHTPHLIHNSSTSRGRRAWAAPPQLASVHQQRHAAILRHSAGQAVPLRSSRRISPSVERQQHKASKPADAARRATIKLPKLLSSQIAAAVTLDQLHSIVAEHGGKLDHMHVAKLLTRTAQLAAAALAADQVQPLAAGAAPVTQQCQQQPGTAASQHQQQQHVQLLCSTLPSMMAQRARHATPETLVAAVGAMGRLAGLLQALAAYSSPHQPPPPRRQQQQQQQLQMLAARAQELSLKFSVSQLSVLCWGLAKAGLQGNGPTVDALLDTFMLRCHEAEMQQEQHLGQGMKQEQQVSSTNRRQPDGLLQRPTRQPAASLQPPQQQQQYGSNSSHQQRQQQQQGHQLLQRSQTQPHQPQQHHSLITDLALVIYACAVMGHRPPQEWLVQWQASVVKQLPAANMQDCSQLLWSVGVLGQQPGGRAWLDQVLLASVDLLEGGGSQALANSMWAVERLTRTKQQHQQQNKDLSAAAAGAAGQQQLPATWVEAFLEALYTEPELPSSPQALSCCLVCLARLKLPLDAARLTTVLDKSSSSLNSASPRELTDLFWSCALLNLKPSTAWIKAGLTSAARAADAGRCSLQQLGALVWSLALLRGPAGSALLMSQQLQVMVLLQAMAGAQQGQGLALLGPGGRSSLVWALASLGITPDRPWLDAFLSAAFDQGLAADQVRCASLLFCVASLDFEFLVEWLGDFMEGKVGSQQQTGGLGIDLSLQKYAALAGVLGALAEMDSKQLRAAWLDQTISPDWTADAASEGLLRSSMQLPPALAAWVDSLAEPASTITVTASE